MRYREVFVSGTLVMVTQIDDVCQHCCWQQRWRLSPEELGTERRDYAMASKYLASALANRKSKDRIDGFDDAAMFKDRPALQEFMTVVTKDDGKPRETSALMVVVTTDGIKVGLKDDEAGGWMWRTADTMQKALTAIEKALAGGEAVFGGRAAGKAQGGGKKT